MNHVNSVLPILLVPFFSVKLSVNKGVCSLTSPICCFVGTEHVIRKFYQNKKGVWYKH